MESLIKEINYRVKGTEKFWNCPEGAETILRVRAAGLAHLVVVSDVGAYLFNLLQETLDDIRMPCGDVGLLTDVRFRSSVHAAVPDCRRETVRPPPSLCFSDAPHADATGRCRW